MPKPRTSIAASIDAFVFLIAAALVPSSSFAVDDPPANVPRQSTSLSANQFVNPIAEGADPWVVRDPSVERYLWCLSEGDNREVAVYASDSLTTLGKRYSVWRSPDEGPYSRQVWAPEMHLLDDRWHIYFAASNGDNATHLTYVLRSTTNDPLGNYELIGPLATGDGDNRDSPNIWAIDMTILQFNEKRYAIWSGWDAPGTDRQYLYIAAMESPTRLAGPRVRICDNDDYDWERTEPGPQGRGLNEGAEIFQAEGKSSLIYSCGASWLPNYKLGRLELTGDNPLDPASWTKDPQPIFQSTDETYGVGHSCFAPSIDGTQWWHIFHAKNDREPGWRRSIFVQPMSVTADGVPNFGVPVAPGSVSEKPSGE